MSDAEPTPTPTDVPPSVLTLDDTDRLTPREESRVLTALAIAEEQAAASDAPQGPSSPSSDAPAGETTPPVATPEGASPVLETPSQAAAALAGEPIPPAEAEPLKSLEEVAPALAADLAAAVASTEVRINTDEENPYDTLQRLRTKLAAYGEECLKTVQPEVEYLLSLCSPGP